MDKECSNAPRIPKLVSIIAPAYNEEDNLYHLYERVRNVMENLNRDFELIVVENGSKDRSLEVLKGLHSRDNRLNYVSLSRNFGHQGGLIAGLEHSRGDVVISMDADLQHPPEVIPEMLKLWEDGNEIVYTLKREDVGQSFFRRLTNRIFYAFLSRISGLELSGGQSDFRLLDRKTLDVLLHMPEHNKFLRGLSRWIGFQQAGVEYDVPPRVAGKSKFRFSHLLLLAMDGILSFSILPLRIFMLFGVVISLLAFLYGIYVVGMGLYALITGYYSRVPPGWTTISAGIFLFCGIQLIGIGLLGEYLGRIYDEVKARPIYVVQEHSLGATNKIDTMSERNISG